MKVLVTGGCGFIGTNLIRSLAPKGIQCTVFDNLSTGGTQYLQNVNCKIIQGDILDSASLAGAMKDKDAVVHLAASTSVIDSIQNPEKDYRVNIEGMIKVLDAARKNAVGRFVFASSSAPLGDQEPPIHEGKVPKPLSPYGASKLAGEGYCSAYYASYGLETVVLRFSNVYGRYSSHKTSVLAQFIRDAAKTSLLTIYGDGLQTRDFLNVTDLCQAVEEGISRKGIAGECFQIGTGVETSVLEVAHLMQKHLSPSPKLQFLPERKGEIRRNYVSIKKASEQLGYAPRIRIEEGLIDTLDWFKSTKAMIS